MNIVNLQRDSLWTALEDTLEQTFATAVAMSGSDSMKMNGDATVQDATAFAKADKQTAYTVTASQFSALGCYLRQPGEEDPCPYRVMAHAGSNATGTYYLLVGFGPASPTGSDDVIDPCIIIPFDKEFDGVVMIPAVESGDANYGKPIAFGIAISNFSSDYVHAHLSVQRLATAPPQFAQSTS